MKVPCAFFLLLIHCIISDFILMMYNVNISPFQKEIKTVIKQFGLRTPVQYD